MGEVMKEATFSLTEANFAAGDFRYCANLSKLPSLRAVKKTLLYDFAAHEHDYSM